MGIHLLHDSQYIYLIMILNDGINSLANKVFFNMGTFSCQVQGSHLMEKVKVSQKLTDIQAD